LGSESKYAALLMFLLKIF